MGFYRLQKQIRQQENVTCAKQIENSQLRQVIQIIHVQKSKEVQSHPEVCFHRGESLLFRQVESKEEEKKKSHIWLEGHWAETGRVSRTASWDVQSSMMMMVVVVVGEQND